MRKLKFTAIVVFASVVALWVNNTSSWVHTEHTNSYTFIAHRGAHQIYAGSNRSNDTCRAAHIEHLEHSLIENTLPSISAARDAGAPIVEIDVHLTTDNVFAVFHDWRLDCQTNGTGVTEKQSFEYLQTLDIGFGFSTDGKTFPLRGKGQGLMPSLTQVLDANLGVQYLINFKSNRREEGDKLAELLLANDHYTHQIYGVYGGKEPTREVLSRVDGVRGFDKSSVKSCLKSYVMAGWTGRVPSACQNTVIAVPINYAHFLWGWPHKFTQRMDNAGTDIILVAPWDGSGFTSGFDDTTTLQKIPLGFSGYVWTNRILSVDHMLREL